MGNNYHISKVLQRTFSRQSVSSVPQSRLTLCDPMDCSTPGFHSVQFSSATQSCPTLCDPMDCSTPGYPVHHQLPELAESQDHRVDDAIQPFILCCPLLLLPSTFPASGSFLVSQFFPSGGQSIGVSASTSVLPMNIQN